MKVWLIALILSLLQSSIAFALEADGNGWYPVDTKTKPTIDGPLMQLSQHMSTKVRECFERTGTSPEMTAVKDRFEDNWRISAYVPEADYTIQIATGETARKIDPGQLEIVLYGAEAHGVRRAHGGFSYDQEWAAVFLPAMEMTSPWFCSQLMHELYHAEKHRERGVGSPKPNERAWTMEEVHATNFARAVLDTHTFNGYGRQVQIFAKKYLEYARKGSFGIAITIPSEVTALFPETSTSMEVGYRIAQFGLDVLFQQLTERGAGSDENKAKVYQGFMDALGATAVQEEVPQEESI